MDAPVTITLVSNNTLRRNISNDLGDVLKQHAVEVYYKEWVELQLMCVDLCQPLTEDLFLLLMVEITWNQLLYPT